VFISNAYAQAAPAGQAGLGGMFPMILMFLVLFALIYIPQYRQNKQHKKMIDALAKGDEIVTQSGIAGRITSIGDNFLHIEIADNVVIVVQRAFIARILPKGTLKTL